ncbi:MAG TPA: hypothetical protein VFV68_10830 [Agriterribacter sp.]|nr:hypothetical protein [Agriterribacter sp.]
MPRLTCCLEKLNKFNLHLYYAALFFPLWLNACQLPATKKKATFSEISFLVDLNADSAVFTEDDKKVRTWHSTAPGKLQLVFNKRDEGRELAGSGRPSLKENVEGINGHHSISFAQQELLNENETVFDSLITGSGFTWIAVLKPYVQAGELKDVNSFFGTLKNGGNYEGFWAGFTDDNYLWTGARNGITFGRWDHNNPRIRTTMPLDTARYYLAAGRMQTGVDKVMVEIFINDFSTPDAAGVFPVNINANASMLSIGQERDAIQHPGVESFRGEIGRFIIYGRPLGDAELRHYGEYLLEYYNIPSNVRGGLQ